MNRNGWILLLCIGLGAPFVLYPVFAMKILCIGLFASAFGLLLGYVGLLSFGHAAFFGSSAYATGLLIKTYGCSPLVAIVGGVGLASVLGLVFGGLAIRRQGIYFAMVTLALAQLIYFLVSQMPFTGGEDGLQGIERGAVFGIDLNGSLAMYYFVFTFFCLGLALIDRVIHSPFGQVLKAIREHEPRAVSLGYRADRFKLLAFVLSAGLAGLAGALNTLVFQLASLTDVNWHLSGEVILMTLLGGLGIFLGPLLGATIVVTLESQLGARVGSWVQVLIGTTFILCVLLFRRGILGELAHLLNQRLKKRTKPRK
jgi:branched-chain amino acid transport system permease protein